MLFELPALEETDIPVLPELGVRERLTWDYLTHGSPRRHPMTLAQRALNDLEIRPIATCRAFTESPLRPVSKPRPVLMIAGIVILRQMPPTTVVSSMLRKAENARNKGWDIQDYRRPPQLRESFVSMVLFNNVLKIGKEGFMALPSSFDGRWTKPIDIHGRL
jgi:hypothetical protein